VPPFGHVLKVARADEHLQTLAAEIHWWVGSDPYRITEEIDPETSNRTLSAEPFGNPPLKLSLVIEDVVHNLRSGLDHLALALAEANMGTAAPPEVEELSQFPICSTRDKFKNGRRSRIGCAHPKAQAAIKRLQPYRRCDAWEQHPLWILRELSDFDKHRRLPLVGIYANLASAGFGNQQGVHIDYMEIHGTGGPLQRKTPLLTWRGVTDMSTGAEVDVNYQIALHVAFSEQGPKVVAHQNVLDRLFQVRNYVVQEVIPNLQPFIEP
jgi:hypothetical protein